MKQYQEGFTLVEMVVVILIVSVLFLLTVPNIKDTLDIVNDKGCRAIEKVADAAIVEYKMKYDTYPGSVSDLVNAGLLSTQQTTCDNNAKSLTIYDGTAHME